MAESKFSSVEIRSLEKPIDIKAASDKASALSERAALRPATFIRKGKENFSPEEISLDQKYVKDRKSGFTNSEEFEYKLAKCLEAVFYEAVNNADWFGKNTKMVMPTEYDDLHNGVDGVIEFHKENKPQSYLGLALDVTYSQDPTKKFQIIKEQIDDCRLGKVKYFRSTDGSFEGSLNHLPRVVVLMNQADTARLVRDWQEGVSLKDSPFRDMILYQVFLQLKKFQEYVQAEPQLKHLAAHFEGALQNIGALLARNLNQKKLNELSENSSVKIIKRQLTHF